MLAIYLYLLLSFAQAKSAAFYCQWCTGDIILAVELKPGVKIVDREIDGVILHLDTVYTKPFTTYIKVDGVEYKAKCTMVTGD